MSGPEGVHCFISTTKCQINSTRSKLERHQLFSFMRLFVIFNAYKYMKQSVGPELVVMNAATTKSFVVMKTKGEELGKI